MMTSAIIHLVLANSGAEHAKNNHQEHTSSTEQVLESNLLKQKANDIRSHTQHVAGFEARRMHFINRVNHDVFAPAPLL